jgi:uncharacterized membrane protein
MRQVAFTYLAVLVVVVGLDALWLGVVAGGFYRRELGPAMLDRPVWAAAALFYAVYAMGIVVLAVPDAQGGWGRAVIQGAVLGLCAYATFDLTNLAVLRGWPWRLSLVDLAWGTLLSTLAAVTGYWASSRVG